MTKTSPLRLLAAAAFALAGQAHAATDAAGDFLASFTGTPLGALDILEADVTFDAGAAALAGGRDVELLSA